MTSMSIIIATFNRSESIRETLEGMCQLDLEGLDPVFIIIDNNSKDDTAEVIKSFSDRINVEYLFEPEAGKNKALNRALTEGTLKDILVFSDDDVTPQKGWLQGVAKSAAEHPDYQVFGGRIDVTWPCENPPEWVHTPDLLDWGYCRINFGDKPVVWPDNHYPGGPNFWVRKEVLEGGRLFDVALGPTSKRRIMGGETQFLIKMKQDGYKTIYIPDAVLNHRIQPHLITPEGIRKRALYLGRTGPNINGFTRKELYDRFPNVWRALRFTSAMRYWVNYWLAMLHFNETTRVLKSIQAVRGFSQNWEMLRLSLLKDDD
ncbi:MAG: glycosyltransferase [Methyloligellaceae bacterium]